MVTTPACASSSVNFSFLLVRRRGSVFVVAALLAGVSGATFFLGNRYAPTATAVTTTTVALERADPGWTVASTSPRGVLVDYTNLSVDGVEFRAIRLRARTTLLRWHVGSIDPINPSAPTVPSDAQTAVAAGENVAGVVALFNGGFKVAANAGGSYVDGVTLHPLVTGRASLAIDARGHWHLGVWGQPGFTSARAFISVRQNLSLLVERGHPSATADSTNWMLWGDPLGGAPKEPRSAVGVDAAGNLIYVATMTHIMPIDLARAMVAAGVVTGMELDMNPYWPIAGAARTPVHSRNGQFAIELPSSYHNASVYESGWERDFFVGIAEPNAWGCSWESVTPVASGVSPEPLELHGRHCGRVSSISPTRLRLLP
jgi:hypothetical protein